MDRSERVIRLAWTAAAVIAGLLAALTVGAHALLLADGVFERFEIPEEAPFDGQDEFDPRRVLTLEEMLEEVSEDELAPEDALADEAWLDDAALEDELGQTALEEELGEVGAGELGAEARGHEGPRAIVIGGPPGGVEADHPEWEPDVEARIARVRDLVAARVREPVDVGLEPGKDEPIRLDEDAFAPLALEAADERPPIELPWHVTARGMAGVLLGLVLGLLLMLLARLERDLRVGIAGALFALGAMLSVIDVAAWVFAWSDLPFLGLDAAAAPLALVASGLVVLTARRRRGLLLGLLAGANGALLASHELWHDVGYVVALLIGASAVALSWFVLGFVLAGHARRSRAGSERSEPGPYRTAAREAGAHEGAAQGEAWAPRAVLRAAWAWLLLLAALRVAVVLGLLHSANCASYAFAADVALAVAAALAASRARAPDARRAFVVAGALFCASPLAIVGDGLHGARSSYELVFMLAPIESVVLGGLVTLCFVAGVAVTLGAVRAEVRAAAEGARPPVRHPEAILVVIGAAAVPWLLSFDPAWALGSGAAPIVVLAAIGGGLVLRRYLLRLERWQAEQSAAE
ncbi:MAG: hypothetical protein M5U28_28545 [Sandaracinaceae bacterium]|nr:hypothetical protein [Sandaracinaceae bacterium]